MASLPRTIFLSLNLNSLSSLFSERDPQRAPRLPRNETRIRVDRRSSSKDTSFDLATLKVQEVNLATLKVQEVNFATLKVQEVNFATLKVTTNLKHAESEFFPSVPLQTTMPSP